MHFGLRGMVELSNKQTQINKKSISRWEMLWRLGLVSVIGNNQLVASLDWASREGLSKEVTLKLMSRCGHGKRWHARPSGQ